MRQPSEANFDASLLRIATIVARFNEHITGRLLDGAIAAAAQHQVMQHEVFWVPGSFELPVVALKVAKSGRFDAIICIGTVVRHETDHYIHVATQAAAGIARVSLDTGVPCIFGVLTTDTDQQALERAGGSQGNKGYDAMEAAIETANLLRSI